MEPRNYLCVFLATGSGDDIGGDPDFNGDTATWGICRPQVRSTWIDPESHLVFVGFDRIKNVYFLKGWFDVDEIITYEKALERFPNKHNVIIRNADSHPALKITDVKWKYTSNKKLLFEKKISEVPKILTTIKAANGHFFVQNPDDSHEIDNWKCQRIFLCSLSQIEKCIQAGKCPKENRLTDYKGYVIGKNAVDLGSHKIPWSQVAPDCLKGKSLQTPYRQHNARSLTNHDVEQIQRHVKLYMDSM